MGTNQQNPIYTVWNNTYMEEKDRSVDLIALFHNSNGLAKFTHVKQCKDHWTPMYEVKLPQVSVSMRRKKMP